MTVSLLKFRFVNFVETVGRKIKSSGHTVAIGYI